MSHTPHELADDFPQDKDRIREMRRTSPHFAKLADRYHEIPTCKVALSVVELLKFRPCNA